MELFIEDNPNCEEAGHVVFNETGPSQTISGIITGSANGDVECDVVGVGEGGQIIPAFAQPINDSGEGLAYLIYGGVWGIRLRYKDQADQPWDLNNDNQWGEPFKIYERKEDILYSSN